MKMPNFSLCLSLFVLGMQVFADSSAPNPVFIPVLLCQDRVQALSLYEGEVLRGLKYSQSSRASVPFSSPEKENVFQTSLDLIAPFSPARGRTYRRLLPDQLLRLKSVSAGTLASGEQHHEILLPEGCQLKTLAVLKTERLATTVLGYVDATLWDRLSFLDQQAVALEIMASNELLIEAEIKAVSEINLGSRAFVSYALALNSPLSDVPTRFEIFRRIGFQYAESPMGFCIQLGKPIRWANSLPVAGYAFTKPLDEKDCRWHWRNQDLTPEGYFQTTEDMTDPRILSLSLRTAYPDEENGYRDQELSDFYGQDVFFVTEHHSNSSVLRFDSQGRLEYGISNAPLKPLLKWEFAELKIGYPWVDRLSGEDPRQWCPVEVAFWPNRLPRRIEDATGRVLVQGKWREVKATGLYFWETGKLQCAKFRPGDRFKTRSGRDSVVTRDNFYYFICFDEDEFAIETGDSTEPPGKMESAYPFLGDRFFSLIAGQNFAISPRMK